MPKDTYEADDGSGDQVTLEYPEGWWPPAYIELNNDAVSVKFISVGL